MDKITLLLGTIVDAYGPWGLALIGIVLLTLTIQLCYYLGQYARLPKYKDSRRPTTTQEREPVSLILTMGEDYLWLEHTLPVLLAQEYPQYEIVVVYVGNDTEFAETLQELSTGASSERCKLTCTQIKQQRFPITAKTAHNVGIKAAAYENLIFTTPDMVPPTSRRWLASVAAGFTRGDIVIGYCGIEQKAGFANKLIRTSRMMRSTHSLTSAMGGCVYKASIQNFGLRKKLYFDNKGFGHLNMALGEDDLFLQQIAQPGRTSIIVSPNTTVRQKCWGGLGWWLASLRDHAATYVKYPQAVRNSIFWEPLSRLLFFASCIVAMVIMPAEIKIAMAVVALLRYGLVWRTMFRISRRLGESGLMGVYFVYDLLSPLMFFRANRPKKSR